MSAPQNESLRYQRDSLLEWQNSVKALVGLPADAYDSDALAKVKEITAELSTLREQLRVTNEMLAAARRIIFKNDTQICLVRDGKWWAYDAKADPIDSRKSAPEAFAAIREQQGD
jgi:hypothetical protein